MKKTLNTIQMINESSDLLYKDLLALRYIPTDEERLEAARSALKRAKERSRVIGITPIRILEVSS